MDDLLLQFGGAVKALGDGRIGGYLVRFSGEDAPDLSGEFFTASTDFDVEFPGKTTLYYNHGIDPTLGKRKLGKAEVKMDDVGLWVEAQLQQRDEYEQALYRMAEAGKLGWSSGSAPHLVEKQQVGKAVQILSWPLAESSLTPTPCEPRNSAVALKSWSEESPTYADLAAKATILGPYVENEMTLAALRTLNDALFYRALYEVLYDERLDDAEKAERIKAAFAEFGAIAERTITALMGNAEATASLKTLWAPAPTGAAPPAGRSFADHSQAVLAAVSELTQRARDVHGLRVKSGRVLSAANRERLASLAQSMEQVMGDLKTLLDETAPRADTPEPKSANTQALRFAALEARLVGAL